MRHIHKCILGPLLHDIEFNFCSTFNRFGCVIRIRTGIKRMHNAVAHKMSLNWIHLVFICGFDYIIHVIRLLLFQSHCSVAGISAKRFIDRYLFVFFFISLSFLFDPTLAIGFWMSEYIFLFSHSPWMSARGRRKNNTAGGVCMLCYLIWVRISTFHLSMNERKGENDQKRLKK